MRKLIISLCLIVTVSAIGFAPGQEPKPAPRVADDFVSAEPHETLPETLAVALAGIKAPALAASIAFLAAPSMEGRGLGSRGLEAATEYVAATLALAGVPPLAGSDEKKPLPEAYFHNVPIREITAFTGEATVEIIYTPKGGEAKTINAIALSENIETLDDEQGEARIHHQIS